MFKIILFCIFLTVGFCSKSSNKPKDPCTDYPSCKLISDQMFENYCTRSTLRNMCPSHCDKKCKNSTVEATVRVLDLSSIEEEEFEDEEVTESTTTTTTTKKPAKSSKKKVAKIKTKIDETETTQEAVTTTTRKPKVKSTTTTTTTTTTTKPTSPPTTTTEEDIEEEQSEEIEETTTQKPIKVKTNKTSPTTTTTTTPLQTTTTSTITTTTKKVLQTEKDNSATTKTVANLPNGYFKTIYVPLYEAGFVQRVIPTSNKPECDFSRALICKKDNCSRNAVWCPMTNDVPKEQLEILFNYTTDIYMFETQGRIQTNETVTNFLFQYLNDAGVLVSHMYRTDTKNSTVINKFMFEPAIRTNYIRLTPIDYVVSIALRFEVYSKGVLYNPDTKK